MKKMRFLIICCLSILLLPYMTVSGKSLQSKHLVRSGAALSPSKPFYIRSFLCLPDGRKVLFQGKELLPKEEPFDFHHSNWSIYRIDIKNSSVSRLLPLRIATDETWDWVRNGSSIIGKILPISDSMTNKKYEAKYSQDLLGTIALLELRKLTLSPIDSNKNYADFLARVDPKRQKVALLRMDLSLYDARIGEKAKTVKEYLFSTETNDPRYYSVWISDIDGSHQKLVAEKAFPCGFSSNGKSVYYLADMQIHDKEGIYSRGDLYKADLSSGKKTQLTFSSDVKEARPLWKRKALLLIRQNLKDGSYSYWLMPESGGDQKLLLRYDKNIQNLIQSAGLLVLSPDGEYSVFEGHKIINKVAYSEIYLMNLRNGEISGLTQGNDHWHDPQWFPSGQKIICAKYDKKTGDEIWIIELRTKTAERVWPKNRK